MKQYRQTYQLWIDKKRNEKTPEMFSQKVEKMYDQFNFIKTEKQIESHRTKNLHQTQQIYFMPEESNIIELIHNQNKTKFISRKKKEKLEIQPSPHTICIPPPLFINIKQLNVKQVNKKNQLFTARRRFLTAQDENYLRNNNLIELFPLKNTIIQPLTKRQGTFRSWSRKSSDNLSIKRQF